MPTAATVEPIKFDRAIRHIVVGDETSCALLDDGGLRCFKEDPLSSAITGHIPKNGEKLPEFPQSDIELGVPVKQVAVSLRGNRICAVRNDGAVFCWGENSGGLRMGATVGYGRTDNIGDDETPAEIGPVPLNVPASD